MLKFVGDVLVEDLEVRVESIYVSIGGYVLVNEMFSLDKRIATEVLVLNRISQMEQLDKNIVKTECRKKLIRIGKLVRKHYNDVCDEFIQRNLVMLNDIENKLDA